MYLHVLCDQLIIRAVAFMGINTVSYFMPVNYFYASVRWPKSEFRIPTIFGIRNCEVYIIWASGNS